MKQYAKLYREAARRIAESELTYSCIAIAEQNSHYDGRYSWKLPEVHAYLDLYDAACGDSLQLRIQGEAEPSRNLRVMLLCMAAAVAAAGDL